MGDREPDESTTGARLAAGAIAVVIVLSVLAAPLGAVAAQEGTGSGNTPTATSTPRASPTPTLAATPTAPPTATPTETATGTPTSTPTATPDPFADNSEAAGSSSAATATATATAEPRATATPAGIESAGERYTYNELRAGGAQVFSGNPAVRYLGYQGGAALTHKPASLFGSEYKPLEPGDTVANDELRFLLRMNRDIDQWNATVHIAFWTTTERNGTTVLESVETVERQLALDGGYSTESVQLPAHRSPKRMTVWITHNGVEIEGARWVSEHHSNDATEPVAIDSAGDLWRWTFANVLLVGLVGLPVGGLWSRKALDRAYAAPNIPTIVYAVAGVMATVIGGTALYFSFADVLTSAPILFGISLVVFGTLVYLESAGRPDGKAQIERDDLGAGENPTGKSRPGVLKREIRNLPYVVRNGRLAFVKSGLTAFAARYFAEPATIDLNKHNAKIEATGDVSKVLRQHPVTDGLDEIPPLSELWTPAHFERTRPFEHVAGGVGALLIVPGVASELLGGAGINGTGWLAWTVPLVGIPILLLASYEAVPGSLEWDPAPIHAADAMEILALGRRDAKQATTLGKAVEKISELQANNQRELDELLDSKAESLVEQGLGEGVGVDALEHDSEGEQFRPGTHGDADPAANGSGADGGGLSGSELGRMLAEYEGDEDSNGSGGES